MKKKQSSKQINQSPPKPKKPATPPIKISSEIATTVDNVPLSKFESNTGKFTVLLPKNWKISEKRKSKNVLAIAPEDKKSTEYREEISILLDRPSAIKFDPKTQENARQKVDFEGFYTSYKNGLPKTLLDLKILKEEDTILNGKKAKSLEYTYTGKQDKRDYSLRAKTYMLATDYDVFTITTRQDAKKYKSKEDLMKMVTGSFTVK